MPAKVDGEKNSGYDGKAASIDQQSQIMEKILSIRRSKKSMDSRFRENPCQLLKNVNKDRLQVMQKGVSALRWVKIKAETLPAP